VAVAQCARKMTIQPGRLIVAWHRVLAEPPLELILLVIALVAAALSLVAS
jgi:hypothetical protein